VTQFVKTKLSEGKSFPTKQMDPAILQALQAPRKMRSTICIPPSDTVAQAKIAAVINKGTPFFFQ
jgi:hypothetical protein